MGLMEQCGQTKPTCLSPGTKSPQKTFLTAAVMPPAPGSRIASQGRLPVPGGLKGQLTDPPVPAGEVLVPVKGGDSGPSLTWVQAP